MLFHKLFCTGCVCRKNVLRTRLCKTLDYLHLHSTTHLCSPQFIAVNVILKPQKSETEFKLVHGMPPYAPSPYWLFAFEDAAFTQFCMTTHSPKSRTLIPSKNRRIQPTCPILNAALSIKLIFPNFT